jgi:ParB family transcriptional regulator, chromosome partitioning protein
VTRPGGLGRGLGALIPAGEMRTTEAAAGLQEVLVGAIVANPNQPRAHFDDEALGHLADSIKELGVLQPLLVRQLSETTFELIAGERRLRAAKRAGLQTVPVIVRDADNATSLAHAIVENIQREDLNPLEEAVAYQQLIEDFRLTHDDVATRVGKSRTTVTNMLRLLQLSPTIQRYVRDGQLKMGHARALLGTPDRALQEKLAKAAVTDELSVRVVEELVRESAAQGAPSLEAPVAPKPRVNPLRTPGLLELEGLLSDHLDTQVHVSMTQNRGKVVVEFANLEDLERIYRVMTEGKIVD